MAKSHRYATTLTWTGDTGEGTASYRSYERAYEVAVEGKPALLGSSDPSFRGDPGRWNPEELLLASISACHQLWYLHLCAVNGVVVIAYRDEATAVMIEDETGGGRFESVTLRPRVTIAAGDPEKALALHHEANAKCFVANSLNFPVGHEATVAVEKG
ncbi:OsmC family protein [Caulobacter sp. BK020]|uniref:OsmC family protein n=1 Tax=Caulobacter sp. BK020 TaxID=2512117 RepID=UPI001048CD1F|nr:OsmC family protein [Caulobacter sp. BK020]TCS16599.1 organic hydroperoxide reductase OsmC/OhrA [Caulobacter sp. BK020]